MCYCLRRNEWAIAIAYSGTHFLLHSHLGTQFEELLHNSIDSCIMTTHSQRWNTHFTSIFSRTIPFKWQFFNAIEAHDVYIHDWNRANRINSDLTILLSPKVLTFSLTHIFRVNQWETFCYGSDLFNWGHEMLSKWYIFFSDSWKVKIWK